MNTSISTNKRLRLEALDKAMACTSSGATTRMSAHVRKVKTIRQRNTPNAQTKGQEKVYIPLSQDLLAGPVGGALGLKASGGGSVAPVQTVVEKLLELGGWGASVVQANVQDCGEKVLTLMNPKTELLGHAKGCAKRRRDEKAEAKSKKSKKPRGRVKNDVCNSGATSQGDKQDWEKMTYSDLVQANQKWMAHLKQVIERLRSPEEALFEVDLRGAHMVVVSCRNPVYANASGFVLEDREAAFQLREKGGRIRIVPKRGSVFRVRLDERRVATICGSKLEEALRQKRKSSCKE